MREYYLQDLEYRKTVDLTNYRKLIEDAVHDVSPTTKVDVYSDHYTISPDLPKGAVIKIGRNLAQMSKLGQFYIIRSLLFKGEEVKSNSSELPELNKKDSVKQDNKKITKKKGRCCVFRLNGTACTLQREGCPLQTGSFLSYTGLRMFLPFSSRRNAL